MTTKELIAQLERFLMNVEKHQKLYVSCLRNGEVVRNYEEIKKQEQELSREFGRLERYIRKYSQQQIYEPATGTVHDPWTDALMEDLPLRKAPALRGILQELNRIIGLFESMEQEQIVLEDTNVLFDSLKLHQDVVRVSKRAFESGLYAEAILNAFKEVIVRVRQVSELRDLDGKPLMEQAFSLNNPKIKLNVLATQSDKDEQLGFMLIFSGVALGIRNPKAHDNIEQKDPYKTLEYLSIASLLMKRIDERVK